MGWKTKEEQQAYNRQYREKHRDKLNEREKRRYHDDKERIQARRKSPEGRAVENARNARNRDESNARAKEWRRKNPEKVKLIWWKSHLKEYGLTPESYQAMYDSQNGCCGICQEPTEFRGKRGMHIDHCHTTGQVRMLLCGKCNTGLGAFREDKERLNRAIQYLKRYDK